jgi:hypothetical protein
MNVNALSLAFVSPWMAWAGLALAAIPIVIHLLNRRRFKVVPWAAMDFLLAAMKRNRRRLKFERWILLAARCGVLILLGLALARPVGCDRTILASWAGAGQGRGFNVILIDNSYSMAYEANRPEALTHLDQAKRLAGELIDRLGAGGQSVALITAARPAKGIVSPATFDLDQARAAVERVGQSASDTDMSGALAEALRLGEQSKESARHLYIFTDATRSAWEGPPAAAIKQAGPALARLFAVTLFNLGLPDQTNRAVLALGPEGAGGAGGHLTTMRQDAEVTASVGGYGSPSPSAEVRWTLDGRAVGQAQDAAGQGVQELTASGIHFDRAGPHVLSVHLVSARSDPVPMDDRRWRVVDVAAKLKVLIVEGARGVAPMSGSAAFLRLALAPPIQPGSDASAGDIDPAVISDLELSNQALGENRAVILANVARVDPAEAKRLQQYVEQGGTLIWFMGDQVDRESYNRVLLPAGLMPGPLTRRVTSGSNEGGFLFDFNPNGLLHPYLSLFKNQEKSGLDTARVYTYWQVDPLAKLHVERILNYRPQGSGAGDPAITVQALGRGRVVFFSTTANADWTSLPAKPAYVALMNELVAHSISGGDDWMNLQVGQKLILPASIPLTTTPFLLDPQQSRIPLAQAMAEGATRYASPSLERPGIYTLDTGGQHYPIAVNLPAHEADVRTLNDAALRQALGGIDLTLLSDQLPAPSAQGGAGQDWSRALMLSLLGLVALECFMAMRFGHYRRP